LRLVLLGEGHSQGDLVDKLAQADQKNLQDWARIAAKRVSLENKLFRWMMWLLWITALVVIVDLVLAKPVLALSNWIASKLMLH